MEKEKFETVQIKIENADGGIVTQAKNVVVTITGPAEAVFVMLDDLLKNEQNQGGYVQAASGIDKDGNVTDLLRDENERRFM